jgi:UDP-N-acetylmuramate--alanine ligase
MSNQTLEAFNIYQKIHFIGIGGIGISSLARIFKRNGHIVTGSDLNKSHNTDLLIAEGIDVKFGHEEKFLPEDASLVIYTRAITNSNPELAAAERKKIKSLSYPEAVGELTKGYNTVSVCGTHGKTTTTAMIGKILQDSDLEPTVIVGSIVKDFSNTNYLLGNSDTLVLESCEYQDSFLHYSPNVIVLNNIEAEHLDYFKNDENYFSAFLKFLQKLPTDGLLIANGDDANIQKLLSDNKFEFRIITFGRNENNDYILKNNTLKSPQQEIHTININIPGPHNLMNAAAAFITSYYLSASSYQCLNSLSSFNGTSRRFELKGSSGKTTIIDDYGHTPTEIQATLDAAKEKFGEKAKILCIFQPHQYSRTFQFLKEFGTSFQKADKVFIPNIYRTRDTDEDVANISVDKLVTEINSNTPNLAENTTDFVTTIEKTLKEFKNYDVIITQGAGDITDISNELVKKLTK